MIHLVLTGDLHVGKTTVCRAVVDLAWQRGYSVGGILTTTDLDPLGQRLGFSLHNLATAEARTLARVDREYGGPSVGPFHFDPLVLQWGCDIVAQAIATGCELLVVDEIGRLELDATCSSQNTGLGGVLDLLTASPVQRSLVVVRSTLLTAFRRRVPGLGHGTFEVTRANRDAAPMQVARRLSLCGFAWSMTF